MEFTIRQIDDIHDRFGTSKTLLKYTQALCAIGVEYYDSYLTDGHSEYFGKDGYKIVSPPVHELLSVAKNSNKERFLKHLKLHEQQKTDYMEMSHGLAESGIEKWTVNTNDMTMTFFDKAGNALLVDSID